MARSGHENTAPANVCNSLGLLGRSKWQPEPPRLRWTPPRLRWTLDARLRQGGLAVRRQCTCQRF